MPAASKYVGPFNLKLSLKLTHPLESQSSHGLSAIAELLVCLVANFLSLENKQLLT